MGAMVTASGAPTGTTRTTGPWLGAAMLLGLTATAAALSRYVLPLPVATCTLVLGALAGAAARTGLPSGLPPTPPNLDIERPLTCGMVLLGVQLSPEQLQRLGVSAPLWIAGYWTALAAVFGLVSWRSQLPGRVGGLLALGLSGAGIAAIRAATAADPKCPPEATPLAVAGVLGAGALGFLSASLILDPISWSPEHAAFWTGLGIPTTAEAVLAANEHSLAAGQIAAGWRLLINLMQIGPILIYLWLFVPPDAPSGRRWPLGRMTSTIRKLPLFVWALAGVGAFGWLEAFEAKEREFLGQVTQWSLLMALAGCGYNTDLATLRQLGAGRICLVLGIWGAGFGGLLWLSGR